MSKDYSNIKEGIWFHKTNENEPSIEVTGVDQHRKYVYVGATDTFTEPITMGFDELLRNYQSPSLETFLNDGKVPQNQPNALLGGLDKEGDVPKTETIDQAISQADSMDIELLPHVVKPTFTPNVTIDKNSSEYRMISDAITLSRGDESEFNDTIDIKFSFDIDKVATVSKMFNIGAEKTADVVLSDEDGVNALKEVFVAILEKVISTK